LNERVSRQYPYFHPYATPGNFQDFADGDSGYQMERRVRPVRWVGKNPGGLAGKMSFFPPSRNVPGKIFLSAFVWEINSESSAEIICLFFVAMLV
jgi:hypothetical protein